MTQRGKTISKTVGEAVENPLIGHEFHYFTDRFRILESSRDTGDGSLRGEYFAAPRAKVPEHVHHDMEESFEVISGTLRVRVGGQEVTLRPGQSAVGPSGVPHAWWNPSDSEEVRFLGVLRPGFRVEAVLETFLGLSREGKTVGTTMVPRNPFQAAVLLQEMLGWAYFTGMPTPAQKALFAPVAALAYVGKILGYRASYPEYSSLE